MEKEYVKNEEFKPYLEKALALATSFDLFLSNGCLTHKTKRLMPWHAKQSTAKIANIISLDCSLSAVPFSFPILQLLTIPQFHYFMLFKKMLENTALFLINPKRY